MNPTRLTSHPMDLATGQAAGLAASWASARRLPPSQIDGAEVRQALVECGVHFLGAA